MRVKAGTKTPVYSLKANQTDLGSVYGSVSYFLTLGMLLPFSESQSHLRNQTAVWIKLDSVDEASEEQDLIRNGNIYLVPDMREKGR